MSLAKEVLESIKLSKFKGYKKGSIVAFNKLKPTGKGYVEARGEVIADTDGKGDVTLKLQSGEEATVPYELTKGVVSSY